MRQLEDKVVLITGAGAGIGRELARQLAYKGSNLALVDLDSAGLAGTKDLLPARCRVSLLVADVSSSPDMERVRDELLEVHDVLHVLVNNAGVTHFGTFEEHSLEVQQKLINVNVWGVLHGCRIFLPDLKKQSEAHIVNMSSMAGYVGIPYQSLYSTTKFAVRGLSHCLRAELAEHRIGVTSVHPGAVRTGIIGKSSADRDLSDRISKLVLNHGLKVDVAVRRIIRAVRRNQAEVRMAPESHISYAASRLTPGAVGMVAKGLARLGSRLRTPS
ncbi:MAG: SDR family NAD(P)-dependent oxidoreductase [Myxococcales bacterium]|nr:SDR family NAD(P)-dependent oxidoreductase [Myxococcales bacterium]